MIANVMRAYREICLGEFLASKEKVKSAKKNSIKVSYGWDY